MVLNQVRDNGKVQIGIVALKQKPEVRAHLLQEKLSHFVFLVYEYELYLPP